MARHPDPSERPEQPRSGIVATGIDVVRQPMRAGSSRLTAQNDASALMQSLSGIRFGHSGAVGRQVCFVAGVTGRRGGEPDETRCLARPGDKKPRDPSTSFAVSRAIPLSSTSPDPRDLVTLQLREGTQRTPGGRGVLRAVRRSQPSQRRPRRARPPRPELRRGSPPIH